MVEIQRDRGDALSERESERELNMGIERKEEMGRERGLEKEKERQRESN